MMVMLLQIARRFMRLAPSILLHGPDVSVIFVLIFFISL